jgi:hypothetical protein
MMRQPDKKVTEKWEDMWLELFDGENGRELAKPELLETGRLLERYTVDLPAREDTERLLERLRSAALPNVQVQDTSIPNGLRCGAEVWQEVPFDDYGDTAASWPAEEAGAEEPNLFNRLYRTLHVVRSQTRLFSWPYWAVTAVITLAGGWVGYWTDGQAGNPLAWTAPVLVLLSVCAAFRTFGSPMLELELTLPVTPAQLVYGRLVIILGVNLLAALAVSPMAASSGTGLGPFILAWLVPLIAAAAVALAAVLYLPHYGALGLSVSAWSFYVLADLRLLPLGDGLGEGAQMGSPYLQKAVLLVLFAVCAAAVHRKVAALKAGGGL